MASSIRATASTTVEQSVVDAFAFLADGRNLQQWVTGVREVAVVAGDPGTADAVYEYDYASTGRVQRMRVAVAAFEPPHRVAFAGVERPFPFETELVVEAVAGGARVTNTIEPGADGAFTRFAFAAIGPLLRRLMRRRLLREFDALRAALDDQPASVDDGGTSDGPVTESANDDEPATAPTTEAELATAPTTEVERATEPATDDATHHGSTSDDATHHESTSDDDAEPARSPGTRHA